MHRVAPCCTGLHRVAPGWRIHSNSWLLSCGVRGRWGSRLATVRTVFAGVAGVGLCQEGSQPGFFFSFFFFFFRPSTRLPCTACPLALAPPACLLPSLACFLPSLARLIFWGSPPDTNTSGGFGRSLEFDAAPDAGYRPVLPPFYAHPPPRACRIGPTSSLTGTTSSRPS